MAAHLTTAIGIRLAAVLVAAAASAAPAAAAPSGKQFVAIDDHNPSAFLRALRAGADFVKERRGNQFRVILSSAGTIMAIPGSSYVQRDAMKIRASASGLQVIVCKETIDILRKANKRAIPLLPGTSVRPCKGLRSEMMVGGWQPAPGI